MSQIIANTYEIYQKIGAGGGGIVYLGRHLRLNKTIVLKADRRKLGSSVEALRREVDVLKNLNHRFLPQVYDFIQEGDTVYTVMDFVEGESLDKVIGKGDKIPQATVIRWACQLLDALRYLHTRPPYGILHADIKPANIMLRPNGDICLIDFNIALALKENGAVQVGFSRGYASPEHYGLSYVSGDQFFDHLYNDINAAEQRGGVYNNPQSNPPSNFPTNPVSNSVSNSIANPTANPTVNPASNPASNHTSNPPASTVFLPGSSSDETDPMGTMALPDNPDCNGTLKPFSVINGGFNQGINDPMATMESPGNPFGNSPYGNNPNDSNPNGNSPSKAPSVVNNGSNQGINDIMGTMALPGSPNGNSPYGNNLNGNNPNGNSPSKAPSVANGSSNQGTNNATNATNGTWNSKGSSYRSVKTNVTLDVRSDIYSLGATLYHLFSGMRPARQADEVIHLGPDVVSPSISAILDKAMAPPRELRYGSADEMLEAFLSLYKNDPRTIKRKRVIIASAAVITALFLAGGGLTFAGLRKKALRQEALTLSEYSSNALSEGDVAEAVRLALEAIPEKEGFFTKPVTAEAQKALTDALNVYDLSESYQAISSIKLPSSPFRIIKSPSETRFVVVYAYSLEVYDVDADADSEGESPLAKLPVMESALSTACFVNEDIFVFTGKDGLTAYDISSGKTLWTKDPATFVALSGDGKRVAAVNGDEEGYRIYDTENGDIIAEGSFQGNHMDVPYNDNFADAGGRIFALNHDGSRLAVSFSNGGLWIFCPEDPALDLIRLDDSTYQTFDGAFNGDSFYYIAADNTDGSDNLFEVLDYAAEDVVADLESAEPMNLHMENDNLYVSEGNTLVRIDPDTLEQEDIVFTGNSNNIHAFSVGREHSLVATDDKTISFYDSGGHLSSSVPGDYMSDFVCLAGDYAVIGNGNESSIRRFKLNKPDDNGSFLYDAKQDHTEARICPDGEHSVIFDINAYHTYGKDGKLLREDSFPNPDKMYDTQYKTEGSSAYLEVTWYDGTVKHYDVLSGKVTDAESIDPPSEDLLDIFETLQYRIESSLHNPPKVYDKDSGKLLRELEKDAYLTYVTEVDDYIITEYVSTEPGRDSCFGLLLNQDLETLAYLPNLCDVYDGDLVFDYGSGVLRKSPIYSLGKLKSMGKKKYPSVSND